MGRGKILRFGMVLGARKVSRGPGNHLEGGAALGGRWRPGSCSVGEECREGRGNHLGVGMALGGRWRPGSCYVGEAL
jgi:hypothetical protein